jgi:ubiquinone/menaquinone biosynthesis C-methylase UbiE
MSNGHDRHLQEQIKLHRRLSAVYSEKRYTPPYSKLYQKHWNRTLCKLCLIPAGSRVIDYGCGTGILFSDLRERNYQAIGLDLSLDMLRTNALDERKTFLICGDGCAIPLMSESLDAVFCRGSLHHMPNIELAFGEIARVLKRGGYLIFSEPSNDSVINRVVRRFMYRRSEEFHEDDEGLRRKQVLPLLSSLGLAVDYSRGFGFLAYTLAGFPDKLGLLSVVPGNCQITRFLIGLDSFLETLPAINSLALHWIVRARKL